VHVRLLSSLLLLALFSVVALAQQPPAAQPKPPAKTHLKVGDPAPDFTLRATDGKSYKLSDFKGKKNVVLAIYVLAFTGG
jgi:cytochrome oxidase Cu insertion factor (SCO1/SenC/PrrC family)